jgi:hypothetical protein
VVVEKPILPVPPTLNTAPPLRSPQVAKHELTRTPTPKDEFQCSKATLLQYESLGLSAINTHNTLTLQGILQPNIDIRNSQGIDDICWKSKLNIA